MKARHESDALHGLLLPETLGPNLLAARCRKGSPIMRGSLLPRVFWYLWTANEGTACHDHPATVNYERLPYVPTVWVDERLADLTFMLFIVAVGALFLLLFSAWQWRHFVPERHQLTLRACSRCWRENTCDISRSKDTGLPSFLAGKTGLHGHANALLDRPRRVRQSCNRLAGAEQFSTFKIWLLGRCEPCQSGR